MEKNSNDIKNMCINDRYRYFGNTDQAYSVKRYLIDEGKAHGTALGAVSRKLIYTIFALLKSGQSYDPTLAR